MQGFEFRITRVVPRASDLQCKCRVRAAGSGVPSLEGQQVHKTRMLHWNAVSRGTAGIETTTTVESTRFPALRWCFMSFWSQEPSDVDPIVQGLR